MQSVTLRPTRDRSVRKRHPWIFSGAIASGEAGVGETVEVRSSEGETLGYGSYSPASQIRVRMLSFDPKTVPDAAFVEGLVASSVARRAAFFAADSATNACRVVNAESDGLPGVVADYYDGHVVCQFTSAGAEFWKETVAAALMKSVPDCRGVAERTDVEVRKKEGLEKTGEESRSAMDSSNSTVRLSSSSSPSPSPSSSSSPSFNVLLGEEPPELIEIAEGPIRYFVDVRRGHKTGFYLDQRDARTAVGALAKGRTVLNCFSYTGGFGLAAAAGGAMHVTQVDVSAEALALAKKNAGRMDEEVRRSEERMKKSAETSSPSSSSSSFDYAEADVFQYLRQCRDARKTFDLIVLDPPKFAETKAQVMKAARGYKDINLLAMKLLNPDGILATFSCSGAMTAELFDTVLAEAARDAGRDFQMIARTRQGADHPVALNFPEGLYLKGVVLRRMS